MSTSERLQIGARRVARGACIVVAATLVATTMTSFARADEPFGLGPLMQTLARTRSGEATFTEEREVSALDRTLLSSGRLSFEAPDTFVRETLRPANEKLAVRGNQLTMARGGRSRTVDLDAVPEAAVIVEAIRGTLTGNRATLERLFEVTLSGTPARWALALTPRDLRLRGQVSSVRVSGSDGQVREVQVRLADGDRSVMKVAPLAGGPAP